MAGDLSGGRKPALPPLAGSHEEASRGPGGFRREPAGEHRIVPPREDGSDALEHRRPELPLDAPVRVARQLREALRDLERARQELGRRDQLVDDAPGKGRRWIRVGGAEDEAPTDRWGQLGAYDLHRRDGIRDARRRLGETELVRALGAEAVVGGERDHQPPRDRVAVDGSDDGEREAIEGEQEPVDHRHHGALRVGAVGRDALEIDPGREEATLSREHHGTNGRIPGERSERRLDGGAELEIERVGRRVLQEEHRDRSVSLQPHHRVRTCAIRRVVSRHPPGSGGRRLLPWPLRRYGNLEWSRRIGASAASVTPSVASRWTWRTGVRWQSGVTRATRSRRGTCASRDASCSLSTPTRNVSLGPASVAPMAGGPPCPAMPRSTRSPRACPT